MIFTTYIDHSSRRLPRSAVIGLLISLLAACASPTHRAPVEERRPTLTVRPAPPVAPVPGSAVALPAPLPSTDPAAKPLPGAENAGKPGYYTVKPGDTMIRVGLESGQNWRDIARWSGLDNPNVLEVGQVLRVIPPAPEPIVAASKPIAVPGRIDSRPLDAAGTPGAAAVPAAPASAPAADGEGEPNWLWPAAGPVVAHFDDVKSKGLTITGNAGDPVYAAADGRIVYAGAGLRGYGNLVIVKHNSTYLTAYAHNQTLLVKEDQVVRRGQQIAEMGSSDAERVQLHFEIRRQGKPVDPARLLPPR